MKALRNLSPRPELLVGGGTQSGAVVDPVPHQIGFAGPLGRGRVVKALPLANGPRQITPPLVVQGTDLGYLADPDGNLIGVPGLWVSRLLDARWTEDTRRLGG